MRPNLAERRGHTMAHNVVLALRHHLGCASLQYELHNHENWALILLASLLLLPQWTTKAVGLCHGVKI